MALRKEKYHPLDSRSKNNRDQKKALDELRIRETRSGKRKLQDGTFFNRPKVEDICEHLADIENASVIDVVAQKRLQKKLSEAARKEAEKEFWSSRGVLGRFGIMGVINEMRAVHAGDMASGKPTWFLYAKFPMACAIYFAIYFVATRFGSDISAFMDRIFIVL
jgi:hypothetical protein